MGVQLEQWAWAFITARENYNLEYRATICYTPTIHNKAQSNYPAGYRPGCAPPDRKTQKTQREKMDQMQAHQPSGVQGITKGTTYKHTGNKSWQNSTAWHEYITNRR